MKEASDGPALQSGDAAEIAFYVASTGGDYLYGVPNRELGAAAGSVLDSYRMVRGANEPHSRTSSCLFLTDHLTLPLLLRLLQP